MPISKRTPRAAAILFGLTACVCAACGGKSTVGAPTRTPLDIGMATSIQEWLTWKQGPGQFLDRDFYDCYELNNAPIPEATPLPDPSGHSRARRFCNEAIAAVVASLPDYERLASMAQQLTPPRDKDTQAQYEALLKARETRLQWAQQLTTASQQNNTEMLQALRKQIPAIESLESAALGIDLSGIGTPAPRPTLPFIPGVPTASSTTTSP